jgi:hypothetical protein
MKAWVAAMVPKVANDGIVYTLMSLGLADTVADAEKIVTLNRMNREFIKTAVADMQGRSFTSNAECDAESADGCSRGYSGGYAVESNART